MIRFLLLFGAVSIRLLSTGAEKQPDLQRLLDSPEQLSKAIITYSSGLTLGGDGFQGRIEELTVLGNGHVVLQVIPNLGRTELLPTCKTTVKQDHVRELIKLIVDRHFLELSEKNYYYATASFDEEDIKLQTIAISDGDATARRTFGTGVYFRKPETLPPDFVAVASALQDLAKIARANKPCHFGPRVSLGRCPFPGILCSEKNSSSLRSSQ